MTRLPPRLSQAARKLRRMSLEEIRVRAAQAASIRLARLGLKQAGRELSTREVVRKLRPDVGSIDALVGRARDTSRPCYFFPAFHDKDGTLAAVRHHFAQQQDAILTKAERIEAGIFDLLGYRGLSFGDPIDWHCDPVSGTTNSLIHWSRIPYLDAARVGDHKVIWELNRHHYFVTLGQAYWLTGEERYSHTWITHLTSWLDANPPHLGINWASSLEVAFRAISWLWALQYFRLSPTLEPGVLRRIVGSLYQHGRHIEQYLSTFFSPNTHLTGEALGLFYLGLLLPDLRRAGRWRALGQSILEREVMKQVFDDGVYFEQATYYQRYTADFYLHFVILAEANQVPIRASTRRRLEALLDHLMLIQRPDGTTPLIGDDDGGRLVLLADSAPDDFRGTLATAGIVFERPDYCYVAGALSAEVAWLLGRSGVERFSALSKSPPDHASKAFANGGYYVMRDGWDEHANYLLITCGPHGSETGGHAHADVLSIDVAAQGRATVIDPGTGSYTAQPAWREYFRSSAAHNTVTVDDQSSSVAVGPFRWDPVARGTVHAWYTHPQFDFFEGSHDGFERLSPPARHTRSVFFVKKLGWVVRDLVASSAQHVITVHFHCSPASDEVESADTTLRVGGAGGGLLLTVFAPTGTLERTDGWVSPVYGKRIAAPAFAFTTSGHPNTPVYTFLISCTHDPRDYRVTRLACRDGNAFRVSLPDGSCDILNGIAGPLETSRIRTDAAWVALRRTPQGTPMDAVMLDGSLLVIDGNEVVAADSARGCYVGRWQKGHWDMAPHLAPGA